jgi:hypothetical protein
MKARNLRTPSSKRSADITASASLDELSKFNDSVDDNSCADKSAVMRARFRTVADASGGDFSVGNFVQASHPEPGNTGR